MTNKSDLLEDQQIHYIVKDYRRMFNMHEQLVNACKEASEALSKKDKKISVLEKRLEDVVDSLRIKEIKQQISVVSGQFLSCKLHAEKGLNMLNSILELLKHAELGGSVDKKLSQLDAGKENKLMRCIKKILKIKTND